MLDASPDVSAGNAAGLDPSLSTENGFCPGCKKSVVDENGGVVVAFGQSFFHVDCFKCAKCGNQVTADTNLLLLSDGSPICANCSYSCNVCKLPILDEAIMTGDDSYHAHCFKCKVCKNRIDELVFAKTSQGIYCMNCHNQRVARSRRHAQRQREKEQERQRERERAAAALTAPGTTGADTSSRRDQSDGAASPASTTTKSPPTALPLSKRPSTAATAEPARSSTYDSSVQSSLGRSVVPSGSRADSLAVPDGSDRSLLSRKSFDGGVRPPLRTTPSANSLSTTASSSSYGLGIPNGETSRKDKRRSINPAMALGSSSTVSSPANVTPSSFLPSPSSAHDPRPSSPFHDYFTAGHTMSPPTHTDNADFTPFSRMGASSTRPSTPLSARGSIEHGGQRERTYSGPTPYRSLEQTPRGPSRSGPGLPSRPNARPDHLRESPSAGGLPSRPSSIPTPTSPSHRVDVPHGIESGTDTEAESDEHRMTTEPESMLDLPPALPPKDSPSGKPGMRPPLLRLDTADIRRDTSDARRLDSEEPTDSPESSPVERTSHATFIAPALPPIRISMGGTDFSELLKSVGGNVLKLDQIAETTKEGGRKLDLSAASPSAFMASDNSAHSRTLGGSSHAPSPTSTLDENNAIRRSLDALSGRRDSLTSSTHTHIKVTAPDNGPEPLRTSLSDSLMRQLQDIVTYAADEGSPHVVLELDLAQTLLKLLAEEKDAYNDLKRKFDGMRRASQRYEDGLTVAQTEYDRELKGRRDAEAEVTRLRVLLSGQAVRLSAISADTKRQEAQKQLSEELSKNLSDLGRSVSKLKVDRDLVLAEVEQLSASKSSPAVDNEDGAGSFTRALSMRFDNIKNQYQHELLPLTEQREALMREITELKASREAFLEETTVLNARNEELAQLNAQYVRRLEAVGLDSSAARNDNSSQEGSDMTHDRYRQIQDLSSSVTSSTVAFTEESAESKFIKVSKPDVMEMPGPQTKAGKFIKWPGHKTPKENLPMVSWPEPSKPKGGKEHAFQQISVLRVARCDHCGDKMWGSQYRCTGCNFAVHIRCLPHVQSTCSQQGVNSRDEPSRPLAPLPPSMFGRDLTEQVRAEARDEPRPIPILVEKCIEAVDALALDLEGIYRKTGGSSQVKMITQLFERQEYRTFDLCDTERFNDICSVTSVLKTYLRSLPDPLMTYALHAKFTSAANIRDPEAKSKALLESVNELPKEHYYTTRALMLHLHRVSLHADVNRMNARNLGVVFGPTLMRSRDFVNEFGDMAGSTLCMEWLIENAPSVFEHAPSFAA
ncbi:hypothetical protein POSPLADRAFT_1131942 [Postia placenta MAD-698-R-SB12]|uniref:RhoGAP-domain-containing protein n=1 Tax=Postia placenta MAD-698-R-SB12 TaxID=670580 RepID=A0A1X6NBW1_9APHY|nr:hypothetical protein POSPLADRAFT_1131942 [Postia placenta MAD-698-R-SB12]OSX66081.1 hypothetical protein POSPLADRAFT_1131942 [Postia placenta MAD-698-R-SB12]